MGSLARVKQSIVQQEPTRITTSSSSIIDHITTTSSKNIVKAWVLPISLSDHFMVFCVCTFEGGVLKDHKTINTRKVKNFNEQMFLRDVASIKWVKALGQTDDVNVLVSNWSKLFIGDRETCHCSKYASLGQVLTLGQC